MHVLVGSTNSLKIDVTAAVFGRYLGTDSVHVSGLAVPSGVRDTPAGHQTLDGARNRAFRCRQRRPADYHVGLESGLVERFGHWYEEAWAVVLARDGAEVKGYSSGLRVPDHVLERMASSGRTHAEVMEIVERKGGMPWSETWGTYSGGLLLRRVGLEEALRNALIQLLPSPNGLYQR
jgi:inosine/xanthosine triphosphatase